MKHLSLPAPATSPDTQPSIAWQAPAVELIGREEALLHEAESAEVAAARDTFAALRRQLVSLRAEVCATSETPDVDQGSVLGRWFWP